MAPEDETEDRETEREKVWEQEWEHEEQIRPPWYWWLRTAYVLLFVIALYVLGESMVHHQFFTGGAMNYHHHPTGP